jgi:hypothetical protein
VAFLTFTPLPLEPEPIPLSGRPPFGLLEDPLLPSCPGLLHEGKEIRVRATIRERSYPVKTQEKSPINLSNSRCEKTDFQGRSKTIIPIKPLLNFKSVCMGLQIDLMAQPDMGQGWHVFRSDWREGAVVEKTSPASSSKSLQLGEESLERRKRRQPCPYALVPCKNF